MFGTNIYLTHRVAEARYREQLAEAECRRSVYGTFDRQPRTRRAAITKVRTALAALARTGAWLMPSEAPETPDRAGALGLRIGS